MHIYWELAERESNNGRMAGAPIYIAADSGDVNKEVVVKLPKDLAMQLLTILSPDFAEDVARVI